MSLTSNCGTVSSLFTPALFWDEMHGIGQIIRNDWRKIINWTFHDAIATKISFKPFTVQLKNVQGDYLGSVTIGFAS